MIVSGALPAQRLRTGGGTWSETTPNSRRLPPRWSTGLTGTDQGYLRLVTVVETYRVLRRAHGVGAGRCAGCGHTVTFDQRAARDGAMRLLGQRQRPAGSWTPPTANPEILPEVPGT